MPMPAAHSESTAKARTQSRLWMLRRSSNLRPFRWFVLFLEEFQHDPLGDGSGRLAAVATPFHEYRERDLRMVLGSESHEPGVVADRLRELLALDPGRSLHHLRGSGLPAHILTGNRRFRPRSALV